MDDSPDDIVGGVFNWGKMKAAVEKFEKQNGSGSPWGPEQKGSVIGNGNNCKTVEFSIWPSTHSYNVAPKTDPDYGKGVIVGKIHNNSANCDGVSIPLPAGHTAIWVVRFDNPDPQGDSSKIRGKSWVIDIDNTILGFPHEAELDVKQWTLGSCLKMDAQQADAADIKTRRTKCSPPPDPTQTARLANLPRNSRGWVLQSAHDPNDDGVLWFDCTQMCCYATADF